MGKETLNASGYKDLTAYKAVNNVTHDEIRKRDKTAGNLVSLLKETVRNNDFEMIGRIRLRDKRTGKEYL